jgi:hypothetical protein
MEDWFATDQFIENTKQRWIGSQGRSHLGIHSGIIASWDRRIESEVLSKAA